MTKYERETIITMNDGEKVLNIYSCQSRWINKVLKLKELRPDDVKIIKQDNESIEAEMPVKFLKLTAPRIMTEEQRREAAERLKKYMKRPPIQIDEDEDIEEEDDYIDENGVIETAGADIDEEDKASIYLN